MDDASINKATISLKIFVMNHFGEELQHHPLFRGIFVYAVESELDSSMVLRVCIAYKKMSVDVYLEQLYLPYSLSDIIAEFRAEFSTNVNFVDMINSSSAALEHLFNGKLDVTFSYKRDILIPILQVHILFEEIEL